MGPMDISLPEPLKEFIDQQVAERGYGTASDYVRELIRKEQDRWRLRNLLLEGGASEVSRPADSAYLDSLRERVREDSGE